MVDSAREICGFVRVKKNNLKSEQWKNVLKLLLRVKYLHLYERKMYGNLKMKGVKWYIYQSKDEGIW